MKGWTAVGERGLRNTLAKLYEPRKVDAWVRAAYESGLTCAEAIDRAEKLVREAEAA